MARNRIVYASQAVWCNGHVLYRVQTFGSTTTFTSEDLFEFGHMDIIDIVDDVPAVAVTLNTNDFGDVKTMAILAQVLPEKLAMDATATITNGNLQVVNSAGAPTGSYLHGVCLADFAIVCGNLAGVTMWTPVQDECSLGTLADNIDQTMYLDKVFINRLEFSYSTGANATENYTGETDNKTWFINDGRFITMDNVTLSGTDISNGYFDLSLSSTGVIPILSDNSLAFLRKAEDGSPGITYYNATLNTMTNITIVSGTAAASATYVYQNTGTAHRVWFPTGTNVPVAGDILDIIYAADQYGTSASGKYFEILSDINRPGTIGAVRQGQVEVYIVADDDVSFTNAWRLTGCTLTADLTRQPLNELGHLAPYDRPLTTPIPITITVDSTMGDLENWALFGNRKSQFDAGTLDDISIVNLMAEESLKLVIKIYAQTDEEAGGIGTNRTLMIDSNLIGKAYFNNGTRGVYAAAGDTEYALKTVVVEHLKITDEGNNTDIGTNTTQTFGFRSSNDLYVVKGDIDVTNITSGNKIRRNS